MRTLKKLFCKRNWWLAVLLAAEAAFLVGRFAVDLHAGKAIDITTDLLVPYSDTATNDSRGVQVQDFTGVFAATRWLDLQPGSYQVVVNYVNSGSAGSVDFVDAIMPMARYDNTASLPAARTRTVFSLWMPYRQEQAQLQFSAGGEGVLFITGAQIIPTHSWAYVRFLTMLLSLAAADWVLLLALRRVSFPLHTVRARYTALALGGILLIACLPLGLGYLPYGHDLSIHLARIEGLKEGLLAGQFPVRMDPGLVNDAGYPFSLMYADALLYPTAFLRILGFSLQTVYKLYVFAITAGTCLVCWWCLRKMFSSNRIALVGSALYTLSFYRLTNVYVRAALGEYTAMLFLPLAVYGLWRIYHTETPRRLCWLPLALAFTGLLQTHLLTTEMAGLLAALFCLLLFRRTFRREVFGPLCRAAGAALLWNLWFLVPLVTYMAAGACNITGKYDAAYLADSAAYVTQIFAMFGQATGYSQSLAAGLAEEMPLSVGTVLGIGAGLFVLVLADPALRKKNRSVFVTGAFAFGFSALTLWMASDIFPWYPLYLAGDFISKLLAKLQFAWRFLGPATAFLVVCCCSALILLQQKRPAWVRVLLPCLLLLTVIPAGYLMNGVAVNSNVVYYQSLASIDTLAEQTGGSEYLPASLSGDGDSAWKLPDPSFSDGLSVQDYQKSGLRVTFTAQNTAGKDATARLPLLYYPGYTARDASGSLLALSDTSGDLTVVLPAGYQGTVTVQFTGFWYWQAADLLSGAAILFSLLWFTPLHRRLFRRPGEKVPFRA